MSKVSLEYRDTEQPAQHYLQLKLSSSKVLPTGHKIGNGSIVHQLLLQEGSALDLHHQT